MKGCNSLQSPVVAVCRPQILLWFEEDNPYISGTSAEALSIVQSPPMIGHIEKQETQTAGMLFLYITIVIPLACRTWCAQPVLQQRTSTHCKVVRVMISYWETVIERTLWLTMRRSLLASTILTLDSQIRCSFFLVEPEIACLDLSQLHLGQIKYKSSANKFFITCSNKCHMLMSTWHCMHGSCQVNCKALTVHVGLAFKTSFK